VCVLYVCVVCVLCVCCMCVVCCMHVVCGMRARASVSDDVKCLVEFRMDPSRIIH